MNVRGRVRHFFALDTDRPLSIHGPIVRVALVAVILSSLISVSGFVVALVTYNDRLDSIQASRIASATDACRTLRTVIIQAYKPQSQHMIVLPAILGKRHSLVVLSTDHGHPQKFHATSGKTRVTLTIIQPKAKTGAQAQAQIKADGLVDCRTHALKQTRLKH